MANLRVPLDCSSIYPEVSERLKFVFHHSGFETIEDAAIVALVECHVSESQTNTASLEGALNFMRSTNWREWEIRVF